MKFSCTLKHAKLSNWTVYPGSFMPFKFSSLNRYAYCHWYTGHQLMSEPLFIVFSFNFSYCLGTNIIVSELFKYIHNFIFLFRIKPRHKFSNLPNTFESRYEIFLQNVQHLICLLLTPSYRIKFNSESFNSKYFISKLKECLHIQWPNHTHQ